MKIKRYTSLDVHEVSFCAAGANPGAHVKLFKGATRQNVVTKASGTACRLCNMSVADADKYCKGCGAPFYKALEAKESTQMETKQGETKVETPVQVNAEELEKSVRAKIEKEFSEKLEKQAAETKKLEKAIKVRDKVETAKTALKSVPGESKDLAEKLVDLEEKDGELAKFFEGLLKSCSELIAKGELLVQKSKGIEKSVVAGSTIEKVEQLTKAKLEANPKLSKHAAEAEVWRENPGLYAEYTREQSESL